MAHIESGEDVGPNLPDWSLCIATLNRRDVLMRTLAYAGHQTCPPREIVVVDVSDDWEDSRAEAQSVLAQWPDIHLTYVTSKVRSSATQRNEGIELCQHEIIFILDDDSFLYPNSAHEVLKIYQADTQNEVAAVAVVLVPNVPALPNAVGANQLERKKSGRRGAVSFYQQFMRTGFGRWFNRKVLLQSKEELFIKYDEPRSLAVPDSLSDFDVTPTRFMFGSSMTVRRSIALAEPFDTALRFYAAGEDVDVVYRYGRHGRVLKANQAHSHHFEAVGGRMKRKKLVVFQLLNMLIFLKRNAENPDQFLPAYRHLLRRRLFAEILKDLLSGRFALPQARGVMKVMGMWRSVWNRDTETIDQWYPPLQKEVLDDIK